MDPKGGMPATSWMSLQEQCLHLWQGWAYHHIGWPLQPCRANSGRAFL